LVLAIWSSSGWISGISAMARFYEGWLMLAQRPENFAALLLRIELTSNVRDNEFKA
jgi:hypothetical protein